MTELTIPEINVLEGTHYLLDESSPLFGLKGLRRSLEVKEEFECEITVINRVRLKHKKIAILLPFVNDATQLYEAIKYMRDLGYQGKIGAMIEIPSAYFYLDNILLLDIDRIVLGMNDFTSFIFGASRDSKWHDMNALEIKCIVHYSSILTLYNKPVKFPNHLKQVKEWTKKKIKQNKL